MHFSTTLLIASSAVLAQAATISVAVGNGSLTFSPNDIKANVGDTIEFSFFPKVFSLSFFPQTEANPFRRTTL
jgi:plastocyanin